MKNYTILLFSGGLGKTFRPNLTYCKVRKFYGELFDVHVFLNFERRHQSVAFNPLGTFYLPGGYSVKAWGAVQIKYFAMHLRMTKFFITFSVIHNTAFTSSEEQ